VTANSIHGGAEPYQTSMLTREETMDIAESCAKQNFLCVESCLIALARAQGIESPLIPRIATGFGAGCGRRGELCGALSGAVMGLGLKFGRDKVDPKAGWRPYWYATELLERFRAIHGSLRCNDLLGFDVSAPDSQDRYSAAHCWETRCTPIIVATTGLAYDILMEDQRG